METAKQPQLVLAGGCGSSGTTLLANLLGRHPLIVAAPEFDVFNHAETLSLDGLRSDIDALFERRRLSRGFKLVVSFLSPGKAVGIDHATLRAWLREASSIGDFYARIAAHMCAPRSARYFVEKTPTNVYNFRALSREIPELPLIHQIRDGRDVAASLVTRGKTLFYAGSRWLYDTTAGLGARGGPRYLETRYEDLVSDPQQLLSRVLAHLGLAYDARILEADGEREASTYEESWREKRSAKGWQSTPRDPISTSSVGRFAQALSDEDLDTLRRIRLTDSAADALHAPARSFGELLEHLGYDRSPKTKGRRASARVRLREIRAELADHAYRVSRSLRYTGRLPEIVTTIGR